MRLRSFACLRDPRGGFRILAQRVGDRVRLVARNCYDFTARFPKIAPFGSAACMVDGEADRRPIVPADRPRFSCASTLRPRRRALRIRRHRAGRLRPTPAEDCFQQALRGRREDHLQPHLCSRLGGHCVEAARHAVSLRSGRLLAKDEEPRRTRGEARGQGGLVLPIADMRNFYKVEKWTKDGSKVDRVLYAGSSLDKAREVFARGDLPSPTYSADHSTADAGAGRVARGGAVAARRHFTRLSA